MANKGLPSKRKHADFLKDLSHSSKEKTLPWIEQFVPQTIDDLAVHKKKIQEVQTWFQQFYSQRSTIKTSPILLLTGPPGVGKTATVKAVCKFLKTELFIWSNSYQEKYWKPNEVEFAISRESFKENESQTVSFSRFVLHSSKYTLFSDYKRVILVEEFPNALVRNPAEFHAIIRKFCVNGRHAAVFIISDNVKGESEEARLFPKDLQISLKITNISFNPVAPTMLLKVLNRINCSSKLPTSTRLNKSKLEEIASDSKGDVRNAINTMQFLCMTENTTSTAIKCHAGDAEKPTSKRDSSLFLFHALGKVLYCKRDISLKKKSDELPTHLKQCERAPLLSNAEEVYEHTAISADGFNLFLHENLPSFVEDINVSSACSSWLSEADTLASFWSGRDILTDYAVSLATRGIMFNIVSCASGKRWKPLHKPQFYENNSKKVRLTSSLKWTFKGTSLSMRELQIDLLPFIPKILSNEFSPGQILLAKELGEMNIKRQNRPMFKTLDEKDIFQDTIGLDIDDSPFDENEAEDTASKLSDDEVIIEEYNF